MSPAIRRVTKRGMNRAADIFFPATILGLLGLIAVGTVSRGGYDDAAVQAEQEQVQVERAKFMLECVADWQYKPETCEGILRGELPPRAPEPLELGC